MKKSTIQDVADLAGVSITTVSRVINKNYPVKESTRLRVNSAIDKLNFRPNLLAKGLIQSCTKTIGIITPSIENLFFSEVIKGIDSFIRPMGYSTILCHSEGDNKSEVDMIHNLLNRQADGIIMIDPRKENIDSGFIEDLSKSIPLVLINGFYDGVKCNYILNDATSGVIEALNYLLGEGCTKVTLLRGKHSYSYDIKEEVYRDFILKKSDYCKVLSIDEGNDLKSVNSAKLKVISALKEKKSAPDGIICCNDWMAVGALHAAKSLGIKVPGDLRIIGFDNTIISQITEPDISTVDQQMTILGQLAAKRIYTMMTTDDHEIQKIFLETKLIIRNS